MTHEIPNLATAWRTSSVWERILSGNHDSRHTKTIYCTKAATNAAIQNVMNNPGPSHAPDFHPAGQLCLPPYLFSLQPVPLVRSCNTNYKPTVDHNITKTKFHLLKSNQGKFIHTNNTESVTETKKQEYEKMKTVQNPEISRTTRKRE